MRVLLVAYGYGEGDVSESLTSFKISKEIEKYCHVKIITKDKSINSDTINIKTAPFFKKSSYYRAIKPDYPEFIFKAYQYTKKHLNEFDIIHHISPISMRYPNPLCNLNKPFIWGPIGGSIQYPKGFDQIKKRESIIQRLRCFDLFRLKYDPAMLNTLGKAQKIITACNSALDNLPLKYKEKAVVIPEGIDPAPYSITESFEKNYIFSSGRLVPYKGFTLLIHAFVRSELTKDTKLLITGDGQDKNMLLKLINDLGMHDKIKLLGKVSKEKNINLMRNSLFCVFPALNEAFGHVNLEAMSMGKPIIVTDNGGPADIVVEGEIGFKINADCIEDYINKLKGKINILYSNKALCKTMSANAHTKVKDEYSWDKIGKKYIELYKEVI